MKPRTVHQDIDRTKKGKTLNRLSYYKSVFMLLDLIFKKSKEKLSVLFLEKFENSPEIIRTKLSKSNLLKYSVFVSILRNTVGTKFMSLNIKQKAYFAIWRIMSKILKNGKKKEITKNQVKKVVDNNLKNKLLSRLIFKTKQKEIQKLRFLFVIGFYKLISIRKSNKKEFALLTLINLIIRKRKENRIKAFNCFKSAHISFRIINLENIQKENDIRHAIINFSNSNFQAKSNFYKSKLQRIMQK